MQRIVLRKRVSFHKGRRVSLKEKNILIKMGALHPVFVKCGVPLNYLRPLAAHMSAKLASERILRLYNSSAPMKGLLSVLSLSPAKFEEYCARFSRNRGLTKLQQDIHSFLLSKHISPALALELASSPRAHGLLLKEKIAFFESFKLDPKRFGVERIPPKYYEKLLWKPLSAIKRGIKRKVLWPLEDAHSSKVLDGALPNWRNVGTFFHPSSPISPRRLRRRARELLDAEKPLRADNFERSPEKARGSRNPNRHLKVIRGSLIDSTQK